MNLKTEITQELLARGFVHDDEVLRVGPIRLVVRAGDTGVELQQVDHRGNVILAFNITQDAQVNFVCTSADGIAGARQGERGYAPTLEKAVSILLDEFQRAHFG